MKPAPIALALALTLSGCSTLVNGPTQAVGIETVPRGADCAVDIYKISTPGVAVLHRGRGAYLVRCKLDGYEPGSGIFNTESVDFSYYIGNIFFGLIPGLFVDSVTGSSSALTPNVLIIKMRPLPPGLSDIK